MTGDSFLMLIFKEIKVFIDFWGYFFGVSFANLPKRRDIDDITLFHQICE